MNPSICPECGKPHLYKITETVYSDFTNEPSTSNELIEVSFENCDYCGYED